MANPLQYKCPCCGGPISFSPGAQKLKCPFCGTEYDIETLNSFIRDSEDSSAADEMEWSEQGEHYSDADSDRMCAFKCNSCGGEVIGDKETAATTCPYCGNAMVITGRLSGDIKPDYVIPFKLDKAAAMKAYEEHLSGKILLPKVFKDQNHIEEIKGIYIPFWLFSATTDSNMLYRTTRVRTWEEPDFTCKETEYYSVGRAGTLGFERIPADGSSKMDDDLMDSLEPFDFSQAVPFEAAYLAGYMADRYDVKSSDVEERINLRARNTTEATFLSTVRGYNSVTLSSSSVRLTDTNVAYALYPVWLLNTKWNGENYIFAMNGQSGKFVGNLPVDKAALWKWRAGLFAVAAGIAAALTFLL